MLSGRGCACQPWDAAGERRAGGGRGNQRAPGLARQRAPESVLNALADVPVARRRADRRPHRSAFMPRAGHVSVCASHVLLCAGHVLFRSSHALSRASHVLLRARHVLFCAGPVLERASHVLVQSSHVLLCASHVLFRARGVIGTWAGRKSRYSRDFAGGCRRGAGAGAGGRDQSCLGG
jgi:hypothetical protein